MPDLLLQLGTMGYLRLPEVKFVLNGDLGSQCSGGHHLRSLLREVPQATMRCLLTDSTPSDGLSGKPRA